MSLVGEQVLLRIYLRNTDQYHLGPAYSHIVHQAGKHKLAGATVLSGIMGLGRRGLMEAHALRLVQAAPIVVEMVDRPEKIKAFIDGPLHKIMTHGFLTLERAGVMMYRHRASDQPANLELRQVLAPLSTVPEIATRDAMKVNENRVLLRVFIGESDVCAGQPLYKAILFKIQELKLAGATVFRGNMGFGANSVLHKAKVLTLSSDLPILIEIVDRAEQINKFLPHLEQMVQEGLVTMEKVRVIVYDSTGGAR